MAYRQVDEEGVGPHFLASIPENGLILGIAVEQMRSCSRIHKSKRVWFVRSECPNGSGARVPILSSIERALSVLRSVQNETSERFYGKFKSRCDIPTKGEYRSWVKTGECRKQTSEGIQLIADP